MLKLIIVNINRFNFGSQMVVKNEKFYYFCIVFKS